MLRRAALLIVLSLSACAPPHEGCGLIGCITSPYLQARGSAHALIGYPVATAVSVMGGAPTSQVDLGDGTRAMTWTRSQNDRDFGQLSCSETVIIRGTTINQYSRRGHCGGQL